MAALGLRLCARALSSCGKRGPLLIAVRGPLTVAGPFFFQPWLWVDQGQAFSMAELTSLSFFPAARRWQLLCEAFKAEANRKSIRGNTVSPFDLKDRRAHVTQWSLWIILPRPPWPLWK